jgi:DNA-binding NarL/FixJ family response regulator
MGGRANTCSPSFAGSRLSTSNTLEHEPVFIKHRLAEDVVVSLRARLMRRTRVVIADDDDTVRRDVRALLGGVDDVEIVGEAVDGVGVLRLANEVNPDVLLMDQDMPRCDGIEAARRIKQSMPSVEIVIMSDRLDDVKALQATEAGAMGYVLKDFPAHHLAVAVRAVCNGRAFFHPEITRKLMDKLRRLTLEQHARTKNGPEQLTPRQFDILVEIAKGSTYSQIANKFVVTEGTIKTHIHNILRRLECHNRTQLVAYALRSGLIK